MVCGQIHAPATLPNYVHMHLMNTALRRQPAILETWYVYFAMQCTGGFSLLSHDTLAVWATQSTFLERSLVHSAKRSCLQERLNNGVFCGRIFLLCIRLKYDHIPNIATDTSIWNAVSQPKQTESLCDCRPRFDYEY